MGAAPPAPGPSPAVIPVPVPSGASAPSSLETPDYHLETDTIISQRNGDFEMPHKVTFSRPGSDGTADSAKGNSKRGVVTLTGNVVIHDNGKAPEATSTDEYAKAGPATLTCDSLDVDSKAKTYTAVGHVHFVQGNRDAVAEKGVLNRVTGQLQLAGHVKLKEADSSLGADTMDYNLISRHVDAVGKPITIKQPIPLPEPGSATPTPKPRKRRLPF